MSVGIIINGERCKECSLCGSVCPKKIITFSEDINSSGYHPAVLTDTTKCITCGFCALMCPDTAIELREVGKDD